MKGEYEQNIQRLMQANDRMNQQNLLTEQEKEQLFVQRDELKQKIQELESSIAQQKKQYEDRIVELEQNQKGGKKKKYTGILADILDDESMEMVE